MRERFGPWQTIGDAMAALTYPHGEVVIHDLRTGKIAALWNAFSGRRIGDDSLIDGDFDPRDGQGHYGPYAKVGRNGEQIRTVSAVLTSDDGEPIGLMCINLDVTEAANAARYLAAIVGGAAPPPAPLFRVDWRERIQELVHAAAAERRKRASSLTRRERLAVVVQLDREGLFETRHAVDHAAGILGVSRTTLYNDLRASRRPVEA